MHVLCRAVSYYQCSLRHVSLLTDDDQEGVLDGLMEALKTGSAFRDPARPARKKAAGRKGKFISKNTQYALWSVSLLV